MHKDFLFSTFLLTLTCLLCLCLMTTYHCCSGYAFLSRWSCFPNSVRRFRTSAWFLSLRAHLHPLFQPQRTSWAEGQSSPVNLRHLCPMLSSGPPSMRLPLCPLCLPPFGRCFWLPLVAYESHVIKYLRGCICQALYQALGTHNRDLPSPKLSSSRWGLPWWLSW